MKLFRHPKVTKKYALKAALYRRLARNYTANLAFTEVDLLEMFSFESVGKMGAEFDELKGRNGFALGKWLRDINTAQMIEDIAKGDFCKAEFLSTAIERLHNTRVMGVTPNTEWFPWRNYISGEKL